MCGKTSEVTGKPRWPRRRKREFTWVRLHVDVCSRDVIAYWPLALHWHILRRRHRVAVTRASPVAADSHTQRGRGHGVLAWLLHRHVVRTYKNQREQQENLGYYWQCTVSMRPRGLSEIPYDKAKQNKKILVIKTPLCTHTLKLPTAQLERSSSSWQPNPGCTGLQMGRTKPGAMPYNHFLAGSRINKWQ